MDVDFTWETGRIVSSVSGAMVFSLASWEREPGPFVYFRNVSIGSICGVILGPFMCDYLNLTNTHAHNAISFMTGFFGRFGARAAINTGAEVVASWIQKFMGSPKKEDKPKE